MVETPQQKERIKRDLAACLSREKEVRKVVIFGSFLTIAAPNDLGVAAIEDSTEPYLSLAMKYTWLLRPTADRIPLHVIPVRSSGASGQFVAEIQKGEVVYERQNLCPLESLGRETNG